MRYGIAIPLLCVATACATTARPDATVSEAGMKHPQLEYLRSLEGTWWGNGGEGTDGSLVEVRYRMKGGGSVVEETWFPGTAEETVTFYRLEEDQLVLIRFSVSNAPMQLVAEPDAPVLIGKTRGTAIGWNSDHDSNCPDDPPVFGKMEMKWSEPTWAEDPTRHALTFVSADERHVAAPSLDAGPAYGLMLDGPYNLLATWVPPGSAYPADGWKIYPLTRKVPGSVEHTANWDSSAAPGARSKISWRDTKAYPDLRSEPESPPGIDPHH